MWESVGGKLFGGDIRGKGGIWVNKSNIFLPEVGQRDQIRRVGEWGEEIDQTERMQSSL